MKIKQKHNNLLLFLTLSLVLVFFGCKDSDPSPLSVLTVTTEVIDITSTTATIQANITEFTSAITVRGVAWNTAPAPTVLDNKTTKGKDVGEFTSKITKLVADTKYYVRIYATDTLGHHAYGEEHTFTTKESRVGMPVVAISLVGFTATTAMAYGKITDTGGSEITAKGVVWSTSQNPTISDSKTTEKMDAAPFTSEITELKSATKYYVRAYATNNVGTGYGEEVVFVADPFYTDTNGVTIKAREGVTAGTRAMIDGKVYMLVNREQLLKRISSHWPLNRVVTTGITDMNNLFRKESVSIRGKISTWDVSSVTNMSYMFAGIPFFNQDLNNWDVSNVTNMAGMFLRCVRFNRDLNKWDVSKVRNMKVMFKSADRATNRFNGDISSWDVRNVTTMEEMFNENKSFDQDLNSWNVSNVTNMKKMFNDARIFSGDISSWNVSKVTTMDAMFSNARKFNAAIGGWDVSKVKNMSAMFYVSSVFSQDLSSWDVAKVTQCTQFGGIGGKPKPKFSKCTP